MKKFIIIFFMANVFANCHSGVEAYSKKYKHALNLEQHEKIDLGRIYDWPSITNKTVRPHFILGMKYLHNFMYELARVEFQYATMLDPGFALGYWGELMTYKQPLWAYEAREPAVAIIDKLKKNLDFKKLNELDQALLNAIKILYVKPKNDYNYMLAMQKVANKYSKNSDIQALYALSVMGHVEQNLDDIYIDVSRKLLKDLLHKFPYHPGVLHYMIHAYDSHDILIAKQALGAANKYLDVAQDSSHGTHMPSHIYLKLGMWSKAALSNSLAVSASNEVCEMYGINEYWCDAENKYHAIEWLHYSYLKMNLFSRARELLKELKKVTEIDDHIMYKQWYFAMLARQLLYENVIIKPYLPLKIAKLGSNLFQTANIECNLLAVIGMRAKKGYGYKVEQIKSRINEIIDLVKNEKNKSSYMICSLSMMQLDADILYDKGEHKQAFDLLEKANNLEKKIKELPKKPELPFLITNEQLVKLLKKSGHNDLAQKSYVEHLKHYINRGF